MTSIEVLYCPKAKKLVRGLSIRTKVLSTGMVQVEGTCSIHPGEKLSKVRYPDPSPFSKVGEYDPDLLLPDVSPPVNAGTVEHPTPLFQECFWKTLAGRLSIEDRPKAQEIAVVLWERGLNSAERAALLDAFASTGRIPMQSIPEPQSASNGHLREPSRTNPEGDRAPMPDERLRAEWDAVNIEILKHEEVLSALLDHLEQDDMEAAQAIDFDLMTAARIMDDLEYSKLLAKRGLIMERMGTA